MLAVWGLFGTPAEQDLDRRGDLDAGQFHPERIRVPYRPVNRLGQCQLGAILIRGGTVHVEVLADRAVVD